MEAEKLRDEGLESLQKYYEKYKDKEAYFKVETEKKIVRERYSKGGMELPRGILTEGHLENLLIGNISRGRFVKKRVNPGFVYYYDEEGRLAACDRLDGKIEEREYIFEEDLSIRVGLKYNLLGLEEIMEVKYNEKGKLERYVYGSVFEGKVDNVRLEQYIYKGNQANAVLLEGGFTDNITAMYVTLYMDEKRMVTNYTWYDAQRPDKVLNGVPQFKLVL